MLRRKQRRVNNEPPPPYRTYLRLLLCEKPHAKQFGKDESVLVASYQLLFLFSVGASTQPPPPPRQCHLGECLDSCTHDHPLTPKHPSVYAWERMGRAHSRLMLHV